MTRDEVAKLLAMITKAWPYYYKDMSREEKTATLNVWAMGLEDYDADYIGAGIKRLLQSEKFPPPIATVIETAKNVDAEKNDILQNHDLLAAQQKYFIERHTANMRMIEENNAD